jgi:hypothetical protein
MPWFGLFLIVGGSVTAVGNYLRLRKMRTAAYTAENVQIRTTTQLGLLTAVVLLTLGLLMVVLG